MNSREGGPGGSIYYHAKLEQTTFQYRGFLAKGHKVDYSFTNFTYKRSYEVQLHFIEIHFKHSFLD